MEDDLELIDYLSLINIYDDLLDNFDCGVPEINEELKNKKNNYEDKRLMLLTNKEKEVLGFTSFSLENISLMQIGASPEKSFPAFNIDFLAIDNKHKGKRYGEQIITSLLRMALTIDFLVSITGVHLEAIEDAVDFYENYGFKDLGRFYPGRKTAKMFYPIKTLRQTKLEIFSNPFSIGDRSNIIN